MNPAEIMQDLPPLEAEEQVECEALTNVLWGNVPPEQSLFLEDARSADWKGVRIFRR